MAYKLTNPPSFTSVTITNAPSAGTDATNKTYVDAIAAGFNFKNSCYAASTTALTVLYFNGVAGVGATLTNTDTLAAFSIDGVTPAINSRILIKNQASTFQNGIYTLTTVGSGAVAWILTRATDFDQPSEIQPGDIVPVEFGTINTKTLWLQTATVVTIGTDPIVFTAFLGNGVNTLTGDSGGAVSATAGNINIVSGDEISVVGTPGTSTLTVSWNPSFTFLNGDAGGMVTGDTITFTGGTSGAIFTGSGSTLTESFNYLSMPATTSTLGIVKLNSNRFFHSGSVASNIFLGTNSGNFTNTSTGVVGIGFQAMKNSGTSGENGNIGIGTNALTSLTTSSGNTIAIGYNSGTALTTPTQNNTFVGANSCIDAGAGVQSCVLLGFNAMSGSVKTTATNNVIIGANSGTAITNGINNLFLGDSSGTGVTTSAGNININGGNAGNVGNQLTIGSGTGTGTQQLNFSIIYGIVGITTVNNNAIAVLVDSAGQLGTTSSSIRYKENVIDMGDVSSSILSLRPVTFDFINKPSHKKCVGLIAEEVKSIMPDLVVHNLDGEVESVKYQDLSSLLLNELQKLLNRIAFLESKLN